jgi:hypothetical protein
LKPITVTWGQKVLLRIGGYRVDLRKRRPTPWWMLVSLALALVGLALVALYHDPRGLLFATVGSALFVIFKGEEHRKRNQRRNRARTGGTRD